MTRSLRDTIGDHQDFKPISRIAKFVHWKSKRGVKLTTKLGRRVRVNIESGIVFTEGFYWPMQASVMEHTISSNSPNF